MAVTGQRACRDGVTHAGRRRNRLPHIVSYFPRFLLLPRNPVFPSDLWRPRPLFT